MEAPELHRRVTGRTSPERSRDELRAPRDVLAAARKRPLIPGVCGEDVVRSRANLGAKAKGWCHGFIRSGKSVTDNLSMM